MASVTELLRKTIFEVMDTKTGVAAGYYIDKIGNPVRYKFQIKTMNNGKTKINKPQIVNRRIYEEILSKYGDTRSPEFTQIKETLNQDHRRTGSQT